MLAGIAPLAQVKDLALTVEIDPEIGALVSDRRRLEQILINLLNNAVKFTERGRVTLQVQRSSGAPALTIRLRDTGGGWKRPGKSAVIPTVAPCRSWR